MGLPSLKWLLELGAPIPEVGRPAQLPDGPAQRRIAALFVKALEGNVDSRIRAQALSMAGDVNLRRHA